MNPITGVALVIILILIVLTWSRIDSVVRKLGALFRLVETFKEVLKSHSELLDNLSDQIGSVDKRAQSNILGVLKTSEEAQTLNTENFMSISKAIELLATNSDKHAKRLNEIGVFPEKNKKIILSLIEYLQRNPDFVDFIKTAALLDEVNQKPKGKKDERK